MTTEPKQKKVRGIWSQIRWTPEFSIGEQIAIGVMININGKIYTKFVSDYERFECVYGNAIGETIKRLIDLIEQALNIDSQNSISPQVIYDVRGFTQGESTQEILNRLFDNAVPFGLPHTKQGVYDSKFPSIKTSNLWANIQNELKLKLHENYNYIVAQNERILIRDENEISHFLEIPIRTEHARQLANVISSVYMTPNTIKQCYLDASSYIDIALQRKIGDHPALFILKPTNKALSMLDREARHAVVEMIEDMDWRLKSKNYLIFDANTSSELTDAIIEWTKPELAMI